MTSARVLVVSVFFFKQKTAYEIRLSLVGSEMCIRDRNEVAQMLENDLGESLSTKLVWKPTTTTELDLEGMEKLMRLIDALEDDDDVQRVTTNFEASDEVIAQLEASD